MNQNTFLVVVTSLLLAFTQFTNAQSTSLELVSAMTIEDGQELPPGEVLLDEAPNHGFSLDVSTAWVSQYVADGISFLKHPCVQTDFYLSHASGFYLDVWWSVGLDDDDFSSNYGDEIDYMVGWVGPTGIDELGNPIINANIAYFDLYGLGQFKEDILQLSAELSWEVPVCNQTATPFVELEYSFAIGWPGVEGGANVNVGARTSLGIWKDWAMSQQVQIVYDAGVAGFKDGFLGEYKSSISWSHGSWTLTPISFKASTPLAGMEFRQTEFVWGVGAGVSF